jgi:Flp pilus assembly protein TadD
MFRFTLFTPNYPPWVTGALISLALAACGGGKPKDVVSTDQSHRPAPAVQVIPAGGPVTRVPAPEVPRVVSYEEAESVYQAGKYAEAKQLFARYTESKPENAWGHYMLGLASWKSGDPAGAERAFERALAEDPQHVKSLLNSSRVLLELGRAHEALERVNTARTLDSTSSEPLRLLARVQQQLGQLDSAVTSYRRALILDQQDVWAMNNLGMLYLEQKQPELALGPLARAVELKPTSPVFQNNLGIVLELTGHLNEAKLAYAAAVQADSGYAKAVTNAKRTAEIVASPLSEISVKEQAELFRQSVRMWKESPIAPAPPPPVGREG